jgi:acyl-coenzyme A synthetase/AMP-(fatty) acid ligase
MCSLVLTDPETDGLNLSSIRLLCCGSMPMSEELMSRSKARFQCGVVETHGHTEAGANDLT